MTSSESEGQVPSRKRSRTNNSAEDGAKKARGRPRVDTQDATAADRRRTQIRLAQRAYRQRKETTISSLKQQSTQLHSIIERMNKTFLQFNDSALKSGLLQLNPGLARELKHATETFTSLAKTASEFEAGDEEQGEGVEQGAEPTRTTTQPQAPASPPRENLEIGWGYSAMPTQSEKESTQTIQTQTQPDNYFQTMRGPFAQASHTSHVARRQFTIGDVLDQSRNSSIHYQPTASHQLSEQLPFGLVDLLNQQEHPFTSSHTQIYSVNIPTPDVTPPLTRLSTPPLPLTNKTLAPVFTYSHDEPTFARRLTRSALEKAFHLLSQAHLRPSRLNYVFRLSLPYLSLDQLRTRFKMMLSRSINEDLDFWETPFIHLGGAGTHYPRKDANGNIMPKRNTWTVRQMGPPEKRVVRVESVADGRWEYIQNMDLSAFDGEWFDAYDVQGYLEERWGCKLDSKSSFAECVVEDEEEAGEAGTGQYSPVVRRASDEESNAPPSLTHSDSNSSGTESAHSESITPPFPDAPFGLDMSFASGPNPNFSNLDLSFDQTLGLDLAPGYDYGFPSNGSGSFGIDMHLGLDMMGEVEMLPRQRKKKVAWLEVGTLIDELIKHGVCLGRAPGFRRKDVDMAVQKALVSTY